MRLITKEDAYKIALGYLHDLGSNPDRPLMLLDDQTREIKSGWVFFYNTKEYIETGNLNNQWGQTRLIEGKTNGVRLD